MTDPRFWWLQLDKQQHIADLLINTAVTLDPVVSHRLAGPEIPLYGIIDENEGGVIAYAIGADHANRIVNALEANPE